MYSISVPLGICIVTPLTNPVSYWTVLNHYGISNKDLKELDLSYDELFEIYKMIQQHEHVRNFLKQLKSKIEMTSK